MIPLKMEIWSHMHFERNIEAYGLSSLPGHWNIENQHTDHAAPLSHLEPEPLWTDLTSIED